MKLSTLVVRWATASALGAATLAALPSVASAASGDHLVINEIYNNGGSSGASHTHKFFELYNPTDEDVTVSGWSLQYKSATGAAFSSSTPLGDKHLEPGGHLLVQGATNSSANPAPTPSFAADVIGSLNTAGASGVVALSKSTATLSTSLTDPNLVDLIGYGATANLHEGATRAPTGSVTLGITRNAQHTDTDVNGTDFATAAPTPVGCGSTCNGPGDDATPTPADPVEATIAEIQGDGAASPFVDQTVTTRGVVTAVYPTGGFSGAYVQTPGTGGVGERTASDGLFVFSSALATEVEVGDHLEVTGSITEFFDLTELVTSDGEFTVLEEQAEPVVPTPVQFPLDESTKESLEGMLVAPQGEFTITNTFSTNQFADIGLVAGDEPLDTPTNVVAPGDAARQLAARNLADLVTLDDAATTNFLSSANKGTAVPWLSDEEVRVGQSLTFEDPVVLDYRNSRWKLEPTSQVVAGGPDPVTFGPSTRTPAPEPVGGTVTIGTFNVLNYFTTVAEEWDALPGNVCTYHLDRDGNKITGNSCGNPGASSGNGPRGAATQASLARQQAKIVTAINALDADVVSLEEIENSIRFGPDRDASLATLVAALNADAGFEKWAFPPSPTELPPTASQDVIRTALIHQPAVVTPVGEGKVLVDSPAFANAREPYAQSFKPVGGAAGSTFSVVVNHFKSKSSGSGADADQGDGQGGSNASRVAQAGALVDFAATFAEAAGTDKVFLTGDFNAYNREDPVVVIEEAGYVNVAAALTDEETYQFDGQVGSLDHVFASEGVFDDVTGADIWNINSFESVGREYSRFNYNVSPLVDPTSPYRASDHDPELVGVDLPMLSGAVVRAEAPSTIRSGDPLTVSVTVAGGTGTVTISEDDEPLGSADLADGAATLTVEDLEVGRHVLDVAYPGDASTEASSTTVSITVIRQLADLSATVDPSAYGTGATLEVTADPAASGPVFVFDESGNGVGAGSLSGGSATLTLDRTIAVGTHTLTVAYVGNGSADPDDTTVQLEVRRATPVVTTSVVTAKIVVNRTKANAYLRVTAPGYVVDGGSLQIFQGSRRLGFGTVRNGAVKVPLKVFTSTGTKTLTARYFGNAQTNPAQTSFTVKVVRR